MTARRAVTSTGVLLAGDVRMILYISSSGTPTSLIRRMELYFPSEHNRKVQGNFKLTILNRHSILMVVDLYD